MNFFGDKFIRISKTMAYSSYFRWILTPDERILLLALWDSVSYDNNSLYANGLLVSNVTYKTLQRKVGCMSYATFRRSLKKLIKLGIIIKLKNKARNNRYLVGFRTTNETDKSYLLYHLIEKYDRGITKKINNQSYDITEKWHSPKIDDFYKYSLDPEIREFIFKNVDKVNMVTKIYKNGKNIYEFLFNRNDYYRRLNQIFRNLKSS